MNNDKTILILGAKSDIAKAIAYQFSKEKFDIILAARQVNQLLQPMAEDLAIKFSNKIFLVEFDGNDFESHLNFYTNLPKKPDVTIDVFGFLPHQINAQNNWKLTQETLNSNFVGHVSILNIVANDFEKKQCGNIVGISSVAGERGRASNYLYGAAKAGYSAYLSGLRQRLFPHNVHVMTVKLGFVKTKMTAHLALPKLLTTDPEKVAATIFRNYQKKKNIIYVLGTWRWVMMMIKLLPQFIFKRMKF